MEWVVNSTTPAFAISALDVVPFQLNEWWNRKSAWNVTAQTRKEEIDTPKAASSIHCVVAKGLLMIFSHFSSACVNGVEAAAAYSLVCVFHREMERERERWME